jgi:hypothetical protein
MESKKKPPLQTKSVTVTHAQHDQVNREFNTSFSGVQRTFASLREQALKDGTKPLTLAQIKPVLSDNPVVQATAPPVKPGKIRYQSIVASAPNESWTVDLVFPDKTKVKAFLSCIDTYSRKGWLVPMTATDSKRRTAPQILAALKKVAKAAGGHPVNINSDLEFQNTLLNEWYSENNIKHWLPPPTTLHRSSLVEWWHRTHRGLLLKFWFWHCPSREN